MTAARSKRRAQEASARAQSPASAALDDARWAALRARDPSADGTFFYSVRTTGVYCRPSCAARPARPENVAFHDSIEQAARAGFRPCKRCKPDQPPAAERQASEVAELCRLIESAEQAPTLEQLARHVGRSAFYTHRMFKAVSGVTPGAYARAQRDQRVRAQLRGGANVTQAIYGAGYNSSGRFYETSNQVLGMTPTAYRAGGAELPIRFAVGQCSLGSVLVAATSRGICAIWIGEDPEALIHQLEQQFPRADLLGADADFEQLVAQVVGLVEAPGSAPDLPLDIRGTVFQQQVWSALRRVRPGTTISYQELARAIGKPSAVRAVARACASNDLAVAIPCHRVVRTDGSPSGYRWGIERKRELLEREARVSTAGRGG